MTDVLVIVDMQCGLLEGETKQDFQGVVERINQLSHKIRADGGTILWIRHCGNAEDGFERDTPSWAFLPELYREEEDIIVEKQLNDAFAETALEETLQSIAPARLLICGWATDFCVDSTVRSAVAKGYAVTVISDAHTLADRPHLNASHVKAHHHWVWQNLIARHPVQVLSALDFLQS